MENKYKLGIDSIDEQHGKWIVMMKQLLDSKDAENKDQLVIKVLNDLCTYTDMHFAYEERLFSKYGYPDAAAHIQSHEKFLVQIKEFNDEVQNKKIPMSSLILSTMKNWLVHHIGDEDKKYVEFLLSKGVK